MSLRHAIRRSREAGHTNPLEIALFERTESVIQRVSGTFLITSVQGIIVLRLLAQVGGRWWEGIPHVFVVTARAHARFLVV